MTSLTHSRLILTNGLLAALLLLAVMTTTFAADPVVRQAAGVSAADIQAAVNTFRADLGGNLNGVGGTFTNGRREINWDAVPDARSAPNNLPFNFFNSNSPRGAVFSTTGSAVQVSAKLANPTGTLNRFGNLNPAYVGFFNAFSPERLFTAIDSNVTDINFYVPGTTTPALVTGFGAVFSDVTIPGSSRIQFFDAQGNLIFNQIVPAVPGASQTFSFLGASYSSPVIARVRILSGNVGPSPFSVDGGNIDVAVLDDFLYGEPQAADLACNTVCFLSRNYWLLNLRPCFSSFHFANGAGNQRLVNGFVFSPGNCRPDGLIHLPGANLEAPVSIQANIPQIKYLLNPNTFGEESVRQQLVAEYIALQLSLAYRLDSLGLARLKTLGCYGLDIPQTLNAGQHLSAFTTLGQLLELTKQELKGEINFSRERNFGKLLAVYEKLQASCQQ